MILKQAEGGQNNRDDQIDRPTAHWEQGPAIMTFLGIATFVVIMLTLEAIPSASVALVVARPSQFGLRNGVAAIAEIVAGDLVLVAIAPLWGFRHRDRLGLDVFYRSIRRRCLADLVWLEVAHTQTIGI